MDCKQCERISAATLKNKVGELLLLYIEDFMCRECISKRTAGCEKCEWIQESILNDYLTAKYPWRPLPPVDHFKCMQCAARVKQNMHDMCSNSDKNKERIDDHEIKLRHFSGRLHALERYESFMMTYSTISLFSIFLIALSIALKHVFSH